MKGNWSPDKSKGYRFYCPSNSTRIVESGKARFIENGKINGSTELRKVEIQEVRVQVPLPVTSFKVVVLKVVEHINDFQEQQINNLVPHNKVVNNELVAIEAQEIALRRSQRQRRSAISDDYMVYLQESEFDSGMDEDPDSFSQAMESINSKLEHK